MKYINKKIIAFDLDGTLAVSKSPVTEQMATLIKKLAEKKIVVIISGGSFHQFLIQFLPIFENDSNFGFKKNIILLPTSGSQRYEYDTSLNKWIMSDFEPLDENIKKRAIEEINIIINRKEFQVPKLSIGPKIEDRITQLSFSALGQKALIEDKLNWDPDQKKRKKIKESLDLLFPELNIVIGGTTTIDILPKGFDKATGLNRLLEKFSINKNEMTFIGDSIFPGGNDYAPYLSGIDCIKTKGPEETMEIIKKFL